MKSRAMIVGSLVVACGSQSGSSGSVKPTDCRSDASCVGTYLIHREAQSGNCGPPKDPLVVLDGKPGADLSCVTNKPETANGCNAITDQTCNGVREVRSLEVQDSACNVISGLISVEVPRMCSGTFSITYTKLAAGATGCADISGPIVGTPAATFDNDVDQFVFDVAPYTGALKSLSDPASGTTPPPSLSYHGTDGDPSPGSLEIVAPFSGANQYLGTFHFYGCAAPHGWKDKVLRARIKILDGTFAGTAFVYVATSTTCTTYDFGYGAHASLAPTSCWQELSLDLGSPASQTAGYDPTSVTTFGIQFVTDESGAGAGPVTFLVDSFSIE